jgi:hypothetical protein
LDLATISLILGAIASFFATLAYLYKGVRYNKARSRAQQGRIASLFQIQQIQGQRLTNIEKYLSKDNEGHPINSGLTELEEQAVNDYNEHDTKLT